MEDIKFLFASPGEKYSKFFLCNHCFLRGYIRQIQKLPQRSREAWQPQPAPLESSVG